MGFGHSDLGTVGLEGKVRFKEGKSKATKLHLESHMEGARDMEGELISNLAYLERDEYIPNWAEVDVGK